MRASRARVTSVAKSLTEFPPTRPSWPSSGGGRRRLRLRLGPGIGRLGLCFRCLNGRGRAAAPRSRAPFACRLGAVVGSLVLGLAAERGVRNVDPRADGSLCGLIRVSGAVVRAGCGSRGRLPAAPASPRAAASALARSCLGTLLRLALALGHGLGLLDFGLLLLRSGLRLGLLRGLGALAAGSAGRLLRQAFGGDRRELLRGLGADEACVDRPVHDPLDARLDLLADELRGVADADRVAVDLAHPGAGIVEADLPELDLDRLPLVVRRLRRDLLDGALVEDGEVVERHALLALHDEHALRDLLDLLEPLRAGADQDRRDVRVELDLERLRARIL